MKLVITNTTNKSQVVKLLSALYSDVSYIPEGVTISFPEMPNFNYTDLINSIRKNSVIIRFSHSTNNRQLFFWKMFVDGSSCQLEPSLEIDGTPRKIKKGKKITFGGLELFEGDLLYNFYRKQWNPRKWNIADTQEPVFWTAFNFVNLHIKKQQTFELEFIILAQNSDRPDSFASTLRKLKTPLTMTDFGLETED